MDEAAALAKNPRGAMVAAAGCGKTHIIATAVAQHGGGRELILTHTHAGVDAIRARLVRFGVAAKAYRVDTIAGWALRLAISFPRTSALQTSMPRDNVEYGAVYVAATRLLKLRPVQEIIRASYSGVYVDEYQDCTLEQHALVVALRDVVSCRIVGDELQGIFDFGDNNTVRWAEDVASSFDAVLGPTKAWRWAEKNPALGEWLGHVRVKLLSGQDVDLNGAPVNWVDGSDPKSKSFNQRSACFAAAGNNGETAIALQQWSQQCHDVASRLKGIYSCVEAIDTKDLYDFADRVDATRGFARAVAVIDFAAKCMTVVKSELGTIRDALSVDRIPRVRKHSNQLASLLAVCEDDSISRAELALNALPEVRGAVVYRRELLREVTRAVTAVRTGEAETLTEAAWLVRNRTRRRGRLLPRYAVGTTLLVKGLEFDHAVVLDADIYDVRNLYVALTRGSKSLTIVSKSRLIRPKPAMRTARTPPKGI